MSYKYLYVLSQGKDSVVKWLSCLVNDNSLSLLMISNQAYNNIRHTGLLFEFDPLVTIECKNPSLTLN